VSSNIVSFPESFAQQKFFRTPEGDQAYLEWDLAGPDAPAMHFAHANGFNGQTYTLMLNHLARDFHIYAWDARGHGRSTLPATPDLLRGDWDLYRDDLERFVRFIGRPVILAGHSMGAVASMELAASKPDLAVRLCMVDPVILPPVWLTLWYLAKKVGLAHKAPIAARAARRQRIWPDLETLKTVYRGRGGFRTWACNACFDDYLQAGTRPLPDGRIELTCDPAWEAATFKALSHHTWFRLRHLRCPVTLVYGGQSDTFLPPAARLVPRLVPQVRMVRIPEATHFVPMEVPLAVAAEIRLSR